MSPTPIWLVGHRGQAAIAATGVSGAALNSLFYRSNCLTGSAAGHIQSLPREAPRVLLKTHDGPLLVSDPWQSQQVAA